MSSTTDRLAAALADRYRLERELGAGGMATVYLAADLKHDRKVAIKVLKPELAAVLGAERFVQEIKTTAALSHPHILPLFDSGEAAGFLYYVMPYIEGETIREKLNRETQFGIEEAVRITTEIADALDYAHRHGVIHRDIKPENILLHDGRAMVMDFGIALAVSAAAGGRMTETGLSLGTPHYMSPEQATADKAITGRSDVYSLASVLYEMLTGNPPHMGSSAQQIIMKIIAEPVQPATELRKSVPAHVAAAVGKALEKLPADRFDSAKGFAEALANPSFATPVATAGPVRARPERFWRLVSAGLAVTTLASLGLAITRREPPGKTGISRYEVLLADNPDEDTRPLISPSGEWVGWSSDQGPVMLRRRGASGAVPIAGTLGTELVAFSPGDSAIAFVSEGELQVVSLSGGAPSRLASVGAPTVVWGPDGWIYFSDKEGGIARIPAAGGAIEPLLRADSLARSLFVTQFLPNPGGSLLITVLERSNGLSVAIWDQGTSQIRRITAGTGATYLEPGYLVFARRDSTLWGAAFDLRGKQQVIDPVQLESRVEVGILPMMAVSLGGTMLYRAGGSTGSGRLARVSRDGRVAPLPVESRGWFRGVRVSPDGRRLAFGQMVMGGRSPIVVLDLSIGSSRELVPEWSALDPVWSLDGKRIAFHARPLAGRDSGGIGGNWSSFEVTIDDRGAPRQLFRSVALVSPDAWVPDGRLIVRGRTDAKLMAADLFLVSLMGDSVRSEPLLDAPWTEWMSRLSPDGQWLAYVANPRDTDHVFIRPFPDVSAGVVQVSERNGTAPAWSRDGQVLYYLEGTRRDTSDARRTTERMDLMAARVRTTPALAVVSREVVIANIQYQHPICCTSNYDVLPDGSGFVMALADTIGVRSRLILVDNLLELLKAVVKR